MISLFVVALFAIGIPAGYLLKKRIGVMATIERLITLTIFVLLFFLGVSVGSNTRVINNLPLLGWQSVWLGSGAILGSLFLAWSTTRFFGTENTGIQPPAERSEQPSKSKNHSGKKIPGYLFRMLRSQSLWVLIFFFAGVAGALINVIPVFWGDDRFTTTTLYILMVLVGISTGGDQRALQVFKHIRFRIVLVPLIVVLGSLSGSALFSLLLSGVDAINAMAVGAGFGYYSLSSIFIGKISGEEMGVVALLANIYREVLTLVAAPLMVRWFGKLGAIVSAGATSMDTTLPVIVKTTGRDYAVLAIFNGVVLSLLVPVLVPFILGFL